MKTCVATLEGISPYSQSRSYAHEVERLPRETAQDYEERTWRNKCHFDKNGNIYIPRMAFKIGLDTAAKMLGRQIPGKGKATYTKFFKSGVLCLHDEGGTLPVKKDDVAYDRIFANADGIRGSGKRVWRIFPRIDEWRTDVVYTVLSDEITTDVFEEHLIQAGGFVGIGRFRPENGGYYGRYRIIKLKWQ